MQNFEHERKYMVAEHIHARGVRDALVLKAMGKVRREAFVPEQWRRLAYADKPLPIGKGQTISQPYIVAYMVEALGLKGGEKVLEIGAGSGYAAAVLGEIAGKVYAIERIGLLADAASSNLKDEGYENVSVLHFDGTKGWKKHAPFDAILVSAGAPEIPEMLKNQLAIGGRMVIPVGTDVGAQALVLITCHDKGQFSFEHLVDVWFVPLISEEVWKSDEPGSANF